MKRYICPICNEVFADLAEHDCRECKQHEDRILDFKNSDDFLKEEVERIDHKRYELGLTGFVGGLDFIIVNTETKNLTRAANWLLSYTGFKYAGAFRDDHYNTVTLKSPNGPDILIRSRITGDNPFTRFNTNPKAKHLPNTRLETYVFQTRELKEYYDIQKGRGVEFLSDGIIENDKYSFIQTVPSELTGLSYGYIEWRDAPRVYAYDKTESINPAIVKPKKEYLSNISILDHTATRVEATERDAAIIEFMELTEYNFDFAIYVKDQNSITNVARVSPDDFAMVFTSGIFHSDDYTRSGPTEKFVHQYGRRVHHLAFITENIDLTFNKLQDDGMEFLLRLAGSPEEGLKQTFSEPSPYTLLVNEYIHRFGDFDGFFTKSNVTLLTEATRKQ